MCLQNCSVKYLAFYSCALCTALLARDIWRLRLPDARISDIRLIFEVAIQGIIISFIPLLIYVGIFYLHINILTKAGAHDNLMTSAFQVKNA